MSNDERRHRNNYWDIDSILTEESRIPVEMNCKIPKALMTLLEANSSTTEVKELPLWLARGLRHSGFVSTNMPKAYGTRSLQKIKAGAETVPLGQRHPYFYDLGSEVALLDGSQAGIDVLKTLESAFAQRYKIILDRFHNTEDKGAGKYLAMLTRSEQALYHCGKESCLHHSSWRRRRMEVIEESSISRSIKRQKY